MRQAILILVIVLLSGLGLAVPEIAILTYVWYSLMRPDAWAFSTLPFSIILAVVALVSSLRHAGRIPNLVRSPICLLLVMQQFPIALSVIFAVNVDLTLEPYNRYIRLMTMCLLIPLIFNTEKWLRRLVIGIACSMGFVALKFGVFSLVFGGVALVRGYAGGISDSNGLALAMVILLPLCWYGASLVEPLWFKASLFVIAVFSVVTVVMSNSRGNMLAMGAVLLLITLRSKYKTLGLIGVLLLTVPALYLAGDRFTERMASISEYEEDASASGRLDFWIASLKMAKDYPLLGVGYGEKNYIALAGEYLGRENRWVVHNTYLQMLVDSGVFALIFYVATLGGALIWLGLSARRMRKLKPEWLGYPLALQTSLFGFAVGSVFYSRGDFEFMYFVLMTGAAWQLIEKAELGRMAQRASETPPAPAAAAIIPAAEVAPPPQAPPRLRGGRPVVLRHDQPGATFER
jgi:probable O-glycosylation ligase (exosortase A-associated)